MARRPPLRRSRRRRLLGGVCGGVALWLGLPVLLVRLLWLVITVIPVLPGLPLYLILWLAVPLEEPIDRAGVETSRESAA